MKVNIICDDGFQQVIQVSKSTVARQLSDEVCRIRDNRKMVTATPTECMLSTVDGEYLSSEAIVLDFVNATSATTIDLHMSGFKAKELEICRLYESILAQRNQVVVRADSSSSSSKSPATNAQQCCKEIISNIERVFDQSIEALNSTSAIKNGTRGFGAKNPKNVLLRDAIEAMQNSLVLKYLKEFLNPTLTASSQACLSQQGNKKRDRDDVTSEANGADVVEESELSAVVRSPVSQKTKKQNTNATPVRPAAAAESIKESSVVMSPVQSPAKGSNNRKTPNASTASVNASSTAVDPPSPTPSQLFPLTQESIFADALNSVLQSSQASAISTIIPDTFAPPESLFNTQESIASSKPKRMTAAQKKAEAQAAAASAAKSQEAVVSVPASPAPVPVVPLSQKSAAAEVLASAPVVGRVTRSNSMTSQSSVGSVTRSKAISGVTVAATTTAAAKSTTNATAGKNAKTVPATPPLSAPKAPESSTRSSLRTKGVSSSTLLNADTQLFPIAEEISSVVNNTSDNDSVDGYNSDGDTSALAADDTEVELVEDTKSKKPETSNVATTKVSESLKASQSPIRSTARKETPQSPKVVASPAPTTGKAVVTATPEPAAKAVVTATPEPAAKAVVVASPVEATKDKSSSSESESSSGSESESGSSSGSGSGSESDSESSSESESDSDSEPETDAVKKTVPVFEAAPVSIVSVTADVKSTSATKESSSESESGSDSGSSSSSSSGEDDSSSGSESGSESEDESSSDSDSDSSGSDSDESGSTVVKDKAEKTLTSPVKSTVSIVAPAKTPVPAALKALLSASVAAKPASHFLPNTPANQILKETPVSALVSSTQKAALGSSIGSSSDKDDDEEEEEEDANDSSSDEDGSTRVADQVLNEAAKAAEESSQETTLNAKPVNAMAQKIPISQGNKRKTAPGAATSAPTPNKRPATSRAAALATAIEASAQSSKRAAAADRLKAAMAASTGKKDQIQELADANPNKKVTPSPTSSKVVTVTRKGPEGSAMTKKTAAAGAVASNVVDLTQSSNVTTERGNNNKKKPKVAVVETSSAKGKTTK